MRRRIATVGLLVVLAVATACDNGRVPPPRPSSAAATLEATPAMAAADAAAEYYELACATCHGRTGRGDGPASDSLIPAPRDYSDPGWQASVTDAFLARTIVGGGEAVGKSAVMPAYAELADQPEMVDGLVRIIRGFRR